MISPVYSGIRSSSHDRSRAVGVPIRTSRLEMRLKYDRAQMFHPKRPARQRGGAYSPAPHGLVISDEQPKREPHSPKQEAEESTARAAQYDNVCVVRFCHSYNVG